MSPLQPPSTESGSVAGQISKRAAQILARSTGRGPTKVCTYINEDLVTILFQDLLTPAEKTLAAHGEHELLLQGRRALQQAMRSELVAAVEEHTGRTVLAFLSANHLEPDAELEAFVLSSGSTATRSRAAARPGLAPGQGGRHAVAHRALPGLAVRV